MAYSTEKYKDLYNRHFNNISNSYECVCLNKSSEISGFIYALMQELNKLSDLDWSDEVSEAFKSNILNCYNGFKKIKESIDTKFLESETLYTEAYELFEELKKQILSFDLAITNKPKEENFPMKYEKDLEGNIISSSRPGYSSAIKNWNDTCGNYVSICDKLYENINEKINNLEEINANPLELTEIKLTNIAFGNIVLNEDYHYCMTDPIYRGIQIFGEGGDFEDGACFVTAAATAFSLVTGEQITPIEFNDYGYENHLPPIGYRFQLIPRAATLMGINYNVIESGYETEKVDAMFERIKNKQSVAVLLLTPNSNKKDVYYTGNGHYLNIVDARENPDTGEKEFLIWETAYENRRDEREGWHTVEEICSVAHDKNGFCEVSSYEIPDANAKTWDYGWIES